MSNSSSNVEVSTSSPNNAKPNVGGWAVSKSSIHIVREPKNEFPKSWIEKCFFCNYPTVYWNWQTNQPVCKNCSVRHKQYELKKAVKGFKCNSLEDFIKENKDWNDYTDEDFTPIKTISIKDIKAQMYQWRDFYGGDLLYESEIKSARNKKQLAAILEKHRSFMEDMLSDAMNHLDSFKKSVGLVML